MIIIDIIRSNDIIVRTKVTSGINTPTSPPSKSKEEVNVTNLGGYKYTFVLVAVELPFPNNTHHGETIEIKIKDITTDFNPVSSFFFQSMKITDRINRIIPRYVTSVCKKEPWLVTILIVLSLFISIF